MANGKQKKSKKKIFIFGGIGILLVALVLFALLGGSKEEIIQVQTEKVEKRDITQKVTTTGKIEPEFKVVITPEVTGEIVALPVKEGDKVKKGDLLIKINAKQYLADKESAEATLMSSKSSLAMRKAELDRITLDYERVKGLHRKGLASDSEIETAKSNFESIKAAYDGASADVMRTEASLRRASEQLYKTSIYSPMDGTVTQLNVELGERVLGSGFSQGTNIMTVSDLNNMEASVEVDENDVVLITIGDTARIKVDAFGDKIFKGIVSEIGNSAISSGIGTQDQVVNFNVKLKLIDLDKGLRPGMSCNADIETETIQNVLSVPIQSVTARTSDFAKKEEGEEDNPAPVKKENSNKKPKEIVFIVKDGKAKTLEVETGISDDNYIHVKTGLSGGEQVVSGSYKAISRELNDGSTVRVEEKKKFSKDKK
ncbi:MAG: efflux transporter periplasmic adaptor subunit [Ignavibacteria bacterium RIFOXYB2_FULL_35_12]|nr:MAG: efflux transporter periplasmic adaptor subunit [Ignavibacteria bacterium GWA2_36_19]OGU52196.1 MAG: efflux transporter periplasmic adaptor subunit [Ignavibacteria bacterium GWC2_35_8]OGU59327.1 MAG: efflux transporter periplasmic adaptor subunit [Ignavibacteria bacterium GWF2_35_20]OGU80456.1 MAG: efflux transporter periplasmic adaptor subunit [Ignavibacteria bacterium RIFOXYA2_FULL_35_9]OGU86480.1 MAG: efflux transporter periplasmic adaptor subunit [Ignavibacteria bacterium RIFOXYA12_F